MTVRISTLDQPALQTFLEASAQLVRECLVSTEHGLGLLATPLDGKYPFIYTRQHALSAVILAELGDYATALDLCRFLLGRQSRSGSWVPRYDACGLESHDGTEADTTALAVWAILSVVRLANDDAFGETAREHVEEAVRWCVDRALNPYIYLMESPTSEPGGSGDFELWNNCAHAAAFAQCHRVYGGDRNRRVALHLRRAIGQHLTVDHRFLRGLSSEGFPDPRTDIAMLAPYYFGLWAPTERTVINSVDLIEKSLWNVEIGGFTRMLPFSASLRKRPPGPMPHVSAWMARFQYEVGNTDRGEGILRWLMDSSVDGRLAEIRVPRASAVRYTEEYRRVLNSAGESSTAELSGRRANLELARARKLSDLDAIDLAVQRGDVADSGRPFVWAHFETLHALKRGGYLERWSPTRS